MYQQQHLIADLTKTVVYCTHDTNLFFNLLQLEEGGTVLAEKQEDLGAPAIAAHIRSLTELRSEDECQVSGLQCG